MCREELATGYFIRNILAPNAAIEPGYCILRVTLKDGSLLDAFFVSEDWGPLSNDDRLNRSFIWGWFSDLMNLPVNLPASETYDRSHIIRKFFEGYIVLM